MRRLGFAARTKRTVQTRDVRILWQGARAAHFQASQKDCQHSINTSEFIPSPTQTLDTFIDCSQYGQQVQQSSSDKVLILPPCKQSVRLVPPPPAVLPPPFDLPSIPPPPMRGAADTCIDSFDSLPFAPSETICYCKDSGAEDSVPKEGGDPVVVADCVEHEDLPEPAEHGFTRGQHVRLIRLQSNRSHNGLEGMLGNFDAASERWQFCTSSKTIRVKPTNIEVVSKSRSRLYADSLQAAHAFQYHNEFKSGTVFDRIWDRGNEAGGIEQLIDTICSDEEYFDQLYTAMLS